jgi:hypothetical protein
MLQKIKQQFLDNIVLLTILTTSITVFKTSEVKVQVAELNELNDLHTKIIKLESTCVELGHTQEELDALRLEFVKYLSGHPVKLPTSKNK